MVELNKIYCGDCLGLMKDIPDKSIDLVLTDPPYGIGGNIPTSNFGTAIHRTKIEWDKYPPKDEYFVEIKRISNNQIIWGGNYFIFLWREKCRGFIVWDKIQTTTNYADCELAWTSYNRNARLYRYCYSGNRYGEEDNIQGVGCKSNRVHPTQKPVALMKWCIENFEPNVKTILDPFCGSGTTCVAAKLLGRNYIGIDISPEYCRIAEARLRDTEENLFKVKV